MTNNQEDRVSYSFGMKINIGNYQSVDFHLSYSTDVKDGETREDAMERATEFVQAKADKEYEKYESLKA